MRQVLMSFKEKQIACAHFAMSSLLSADTFTSSCPCWLASATCHEGSRRGGWVGQYAETVHGYMACRGGGTFVIVAGADMGLDGRGRISDIKYCEKFHSADNNVVGWKCERT